MTPKRIFSLAIILILSSFLLISFTSAQEPEPQMQRVKTGLELTPEQKDKIMETRLNFQKDKIMLGADMKIAQLELRSLMREEELNKAEIYKKIEYLGDLKTRLAKNRVDQSMALKDILTKEQLDQLKERKFDRPLRKRLMQHRDQQQKHFRPGRYFMERPRPQEGIGMLSPETEPLPPMEAEELFFEHADLAQMLDELPVLEDLAEPAPFFEEMDLLPFLEEELPPLPEEPEIAP